MDANFSVCSGLAMAGWLLVLVAPRRRGSQVAAGALLVRYIAGRSCCWPHYLALDLFIG